MQKCIFKFQNSTDAASHNAEILASYNYDIHKAITSQTRNQMSYGSEFCPTLQELLSSHPYWDILQDILDNRVTFPLLPIPQDLREKDLIFHQDQGNHQSALRYNQIIENIITDDIQRGYALPFLQTYY
jgi:hypothetical protein